MKNLMFVAGIFCLFIVVISSNPTIASSVIHDEAPATPTKKSLQHSDINLLAESYTINRKNTTAKITVYEEITNFRGGEKSRVLAWINHQFVYRTTPYCWRKSKDRGIGIAPEKRCAKGRDKHGALCYNKCPDGYKRQNISASNFSCIQANCPGGYRETVENICQIKRPQLKGDLRCKQGWSKCKVAKDSCCKKGLVEPKNDIALTNMLILGRLVRLKQNTKISLVLTLVEKKSKVAIPIRIHSSIIAKAIGSSKPACVIKNVSL